MSLGIQASPQLDDMVIEVTSRPAAVGMACAAIAMDCSGDLRAALEALGLVAAPPRCRRRLRRERHTPAKRPIGLSSLRPHLEPTRKVAGPHGPSYCRAMAKRARTGNTLRQMHGRPHCGRLHPADSSGMTDLGHEGHAALLTAAVGTDEPEDQPEGADSATHHHRQ